MIGNTELDKVLEVIHRGDGIDHDQACVMVDAINVLEYILDVQKTMHNVIMEAIPHVVSSVAANTLARAGRTDKKIKYAIGKICDTHIEALNAMVQDLAIKLIDISENGQDIGGDPV